MNKLFLTGIVVLFVVSVSYPQKMREKMIQKKEKLEQLEKVKLIEALDLNEDVAVRFFSRRNESRKEIESFEQKADDLLVEIEKSFDADQKSIEGKQKQMISDFLSTRELIDKRRHEFIKSLDDILTTEQICKLIVFEKKFRDEIRSVLLDRRLPK
ncbi:MAG TPA: hypothetical protein DHV28_18405 [Ignavibacteriales bacterium]|nr:hypothetical protein [Ignavibacteriales bacterium]